MKHALLAILLTVTVGTTAQEKVRLDGLVVHDRFLILLAAVNPDACNAADADAQLFVSADEGRTWTKHGPALAGSAFLELLQHDGDLWIAGEHSAEGPAHAPFLLRLNGSALETHVTTIYDGNAELLGVGLRNDGTMAAWVRHLELADSGEWGGPIYLHRSDDNGTTWRAVGPVKSVSHDLSEVVFFRSADEFPHGWRIQQAVDEGFDVQRDRSGLWETVTHFPPPPRCEP